MKQIEDLKGFLDEKVDEYNSIDFITDDPIAIPHQFTSKEDIEISALLVSTIAWGRRTMILKSGYRMMELMDNSPFDFVLNHSEKDVKLIEKFIHRTFKSADFIYFIKSLSHIYRTANSLEDLFVIKNGENNMKNAIFRFRNKFFELEHLKRTQKHIANPIKGSAAKRIVMFLRWMCRKDASGVDFGMWQKIPSSKLSCPLDVHSGRVARELGLLNRHQNDWKAVEELDSALRKFDPSDPAKYDFALFGMGVESF